MESRIPEARAPFNRIEDLWKSFRDSYPGGEALKDEANRKLWNYIINLGDDDDDNPGQHGRYSTTNHAVTGFLEESNNISAAQARAYLDVRLGTIMSSLNIWNGNNYCVEVRKVPKKKMFMPASGGRFLITSKGCERQVLHSDFDIEPEGNMSVTDAWFNAGYFVVCTGPGDDPVPVWVNKFGHISLHSYRNEGNQGVMQDTEVEKVWIPPSSVFIGSGYIPHCGASSRTPTTRKVCAIMRILFQRATNFQMEYML